MQRNTPIVFSNNDRTHSPLTHGETLPPECIPVSADRDNNITVKDDGLFAPPYEGLKSVYHDNSMNGDGSDTTPLSVRISSKSDNVLQLIDQAAENAGGLYVPPAASLKRRSTSGNFALGYPDNPAATSACGKYGTGVYWKTIVSLSQPDNGDTNVLVSVALQQVPCRSDKTPVPYQIFAEYRAVSSTEKPSVMLWLICHEAPTHLLSMSTGAISQITRGNTGPSGGLDDLYPSAVTAVEPRYTVHYMYSSVP